MKQFWNEENERLKNASYLEHQKKVHLNIVHSLLNTVKAHSVLLLAIIIEIIAAFIVYLAIFFFTALGQKYIPHIMEWYAKISDFFEVAFVAAILNEFFNYYIRHFIAKSIEYHPSRKGYRFVVCGILNIILCLGAISLFFTAYDSQNFVFLNGLLQAKIIIFVLEACGFFSYYMFKFFYDNRNSAYLIGQFVKDPASGRSIFVPQCYFYSTIGCEPDKNENKMLVKMVRNIVTSYQYHFEKKKLSGMFYLIPGKIKKGIFTYDDAFLVIDTDKELCQSVPNTETHTFHLNNYPDALEMFLIWL